MLKNVFMFSHQLPLITVFIQIPRHFMMPIVRQNVNHSYDDYFGHFQLLYSSKRRIVFHLDNWSVATQFFFYKLQIHSMQDSKSNVKQYEVVDCPWTAEEMRWPGASVYTVHRHFAIEREEPMTVYQDGEYFLIQEVYMYSCPPSLL